MINNFIIHRFDVYEIRDAFFEFLCSMLKHYPKLFVNYIINYIY